MLVDLFLVRRGGARERHFTTLGTPPEWQPRKHYAEFFGDWTQRSPHGYVWQNQLMSEKRGRAITEIGRAKAVKGTRLAWPAIVAIA